MSNDSTTNSEYFPSPFSAKTDIQMSKELKNDF